MVKQKSDSPGPQLDEVSYSAWLVLALTFPLFIAIALKAGSIFYGEAAGGAIESIQFFYEDVKTVLTEPCPKWISAYDRHYLDLQNGRTIRRVSGLTTSEYIKLMEKGDPFIITDVMKDWPASRMYNCSYMLDNFSDAEYFDWQGQVQASLGNITRRSGYSDMECMAGYMTMDWDANKKHTREWLKHLNTPKFMKDTGMDFNNPSAFTGFIGTPNTGISPHLDEACTSLMTAQFSGVKLWSVAWPVTDGQSLVWSPSVVFKLYPGELMVWHLSMRHHTEIVEGCSFSFTFDLSTPAPKDYFEKLSTMLDTVSEEERDRFYTSIGCYDVKYMDSCTLKKENGAYHIGYKSD